MTVPNAKGEISGIMGTGATALDAILWQGGGGGGREQKRVIYVCSCAGPEVAASTLLWVPSHIPTLLGEII